MTDLEKWVVGIMLATAVLGTLLYINLELQNRGSLSAVGWSLIAVVWFVIIRRLIHLWLRNK